MTDLEMPFVPDEEGPGTEILLVAVKDGPGTDVINFVRDMRALEEIAVALEEIQEKLLI